MCAQPKKIENVPAIVLAGGRSRRMGRNKADLPFGRFTMLQSVERALLTMVDQVVVVVARGQDQPTLSSPRTLLVRDEHDDFGPLEGLRVGLHQCRDLGAETVLVATCDAPYVQPDVYRLLLDQLKHHDAASPWVDGNFYPLTSVYQTRVLSTITASVKANRLRVRDLLNEIDCRKVTQEELRRVDPQLRSLINLNTPQEYLDGLKTAGESSHRS